MSLLKRHDELTPAQVPGFGKSETRYPTPNRVDWLVFQRVPIAPEKYTALPYHSPHPDYDNNGLILVWQGPVKAENNQIAVVRVYSNNLANEEWWNASIKYAGDVRTFPVYVRSNILLREDYAPAAQASRLRKLIRLQMTSEGSGYTSVPAVTFTGGGGTGAAATAIMNPARTKVIALVLTNEGTGYTNAPTVGFTGGGGSGAAATAEIQGENVFLVKEETTRLDSEDRYMASLFIKAHRFYEKLPGPILVWDEYRDERGAVQRTSQSVLASDVSGGGGGTEEATFTRSGVAPDITVTKTWFEPRGDSAIVLTKFIETWIEIRVRDKTVTSEFGGAILAHEETTAEPDAQTVETGYLIASSRLVKKSPHEQTLITDKFDPSSATPVLELTNGGYGYATPPAVGFSGGTCGTAPTATAVLGFGLASITVNNGGSGYNTPPAIGFVNGGGGGAFAIAVLGFGVQSVTIDNGGSGYTSPPTVALSGDGSGATGTAVLGFGVGTATVTNPGSGYTEAPMTVFSGGGGSGAAADVLMGHPIDHITVVVAGSGYSTPPTVGFVGGGGGTGAAATAVLGFLVASINVTAPGSGYTSDPNVVFSGGGGSGAAATVTRSFAVASANVTAGGSGYTSAPTVNVSGGGGSGVAFTALRALPLLSITLTGGGSGYTTPPTIAFSGGDGSGATATATLGYTVASASITNGGSGYTSAPTVAFSGGGGTGAAGTAQTTGVVSSVAVTAPGSGYTTPPTVGFSGGGGSGAAATADIGIYNFAFVSNGDTNGSLYRIGTNFGAGAWTNPHIAARVTVIRSSTLNGVDADLVNRAAEYNTTDNNANEWIAIDMGTNDTARLMIVSDYLLRHGAQTSGQAIRNWKLQGSNNVATNDVTGVNAATWVDIDTRVNDSTLGTNQGDWGHFTLGSTPAGYRFLRILNTGANSSGLNFIQLSEIEFYGTLKIAGAGTVLGVTVTAPGTGYTSAPTVGFTGGGGSGATATATVASTVTGITITNPGSGYTSPPLIALTGGGGSGATAVAVLSATGSVKSITLTAVGSGYTSAPAMAFSGGGGSGATATSALDTSAAGPIGRLTLTAAGSGYTTPPALAFSGGGGSGAAATAVLAAAGVIQSIALTNPGTGYTSAPTISFAGGGGSGAAATAVLAATGSVKSVTLTNAGTGYMSAPSITFTGGGGSGATAACSLDLATLNVSSISITNPGTGYTSAPTLSFTGGGGGTGLAATAVLSSTGSVIAVNVTAAGTGYTGATVGFSGGAGSGAAATAFLASTGSVKSVSVVNPGVFRTLPGIQFAGGGGTGAAGTGVLASTGSVIELLLLTLGNCTVAPTVTFSGGGGTLAAAIYHLGDAEWPANYGYDTDPVDGIVIDIVRKVIPAASAIGSYPGRTNVNPFVGPFIDVKTHDTWKSIRITSSVDLRTLPPPEIVPWTHPFHLPDRLLSIEAVWSDTRAKLAAALATKAQVSVESGSSGGIIIRRAGGFHGRATGTRTRIWFYGPPPASAIPAEFKIVSSSGSVVLTNTSSGTQYTNQDDGGTVISDSFRNQVHDVDASNLLVGLFITLNATHYSPPQNALAQSGGGSVAGLFAGGTLSKMDVSINQSIVTSEGRTLNPSALSGQIVLASAIPEKQRFGIWILELIRVVIP